MGKMEKQNSLREINKKGSKGKNHGYISIDKIRMEAENHSKEEVIG